jgi:hypothetical protein
MVYVTIDEKKKQGKALLQFLKGIDEGNEYISITTSLRSAFPGKSKFKVKKRNASALTDEELAKRLSVNDSEFTVNTGSNYQGIIESHRPTFSNGLEKWL